MDNETTSESESIALWLQEHRERYESDQDDEYSELIRLLRDE